MKAKQIINAAALSVALAAGGAVTTAQAQSDEPIRFGLCFDLSKSYTFISPQVAQAAQDLSLIHI